MKKYHLSHVLSKILGIAILTFPVGLVLAAVAMVNSTAGHNIGIHAFWATLGTTMGVVAVTLRFGWGLDSRVFNRCLTSASVRRTRQENTPVPEQRRYPRYGIELPATFYTHRTSGFVQLANISAEGCKINSHVQLALHDCGQLLIEMPGTTGPLKVPRASVRWVKGNDYGLEFIGINLSEQGWLNRPADQMGTEAGAQKSRANH